MNEKAQEQVKVGVVAHDPIFVNSSCGAVAVYGHELISDKMVKVLVGIFNMPMFADEDHGVHVINFVNEELVDANGQKALSLFFHEPRAITVSLPRIWDKVLEDLDAAVKEDGSQNVVSVRLMLMYETIYNIAHEIRHGMTYAKSGVRPFSDEEWKDAEVDANKFADQFCTDLAKIVDVEPPELEAEPFFGPMVKEMFLELAEGESDKMILDQNAILMSGAMLLVRENGEVIDQVISAREFFRSTSDDGNDETEWAKEPMNFGDDAINRVRQALPSTPSAPAPTPEQVAPVAEAKPAAEMSTAAPRIDIGEDSDGYDPLDGLSEDEMMDELFADSPETQLAQTVMAAAGGNPEALKSLEASHGPEAVTATLAQGANTVAAPPAQAPVANAAPAQPVAAAPAAAPVCEGPGGFPIVDGSGGAQPTAEEAASMTYAPNNVDESQIPVIMNQVYMAIYQHIFTNCRLMVNSQLPFQNPDAVWQMPLDLKNIPGAAQLIVAADIMDPNTGRYNSNQPVKDGMLLGNVKKHSRLPGYGLYLNINGQCVRRTVLPQNPNSKGPYAPNARRGEAVMWVINEDVDRNHPHRWLILIHNGKLRNVAAERQGQR